MIWIPADSFASSVLLRHLPMAPFLISRRSLLVALMAVYSQFSGCRQTSPLPQHIWARDPSDESGAAAIPTVVLSTLGEGQWDLRCEFQRALCGQLRRASLMRIVEAEQSVVGTARACSSTSTTWDEQLQTIGNVPAAQAVVSKIVYLQTTAPIKLGIVVELKDVASRDTLRQVEWLWDGQACHSPSPLKWIGKVACDPPWNDELHKISPRHLLEQAAREISLDLQGIDTIGQRKIPCTRETEPTSTR